MEKLSLFLRLVRAFRKLKRKPGYWVTGWRLHRDGFDRLHGTDTSRLLETYTPEGKPVHRYETASESAILSTLNSLPMELSDYTFIDLGCGKGKPLLIAAGYPFRRVIGVDISARCLAIARKNVSRCNLDNRITLIVGDATEYVFPDGPLLVYLFNPFPGPIIEKVIGRLVQRLDETPDPITIVYMHPVNVDLIEKTSQFEKVIELPGKEVNHERAILFRSRPRQTHAK